VAKGRRFVLEVPTSALFREGDQWAVYVVSTSTAYKRNVTLYRRTGVEAAVVSGLAAGERVILYPTDAVRQGARVTGQ
jgi:HlyD family secretion protein